MPRVIALQVVYNHRRFIEPVFSAVFNQTFKDFKFVAVIAGSEDGSKEVISEKFPQVEIIDPGFNIGFAKGHNLVFDIYCNPSLNPSPHEGRGRGEVEFFQLVNPDLVMEPNYLEEMLKAFEDKSVGAATGKLYKISEAGIMNYELWKKDNSNQIKILDTTGVNISKSGRARDRGQHEVDRGQYDASILVNAVSGAGCMYRRAALEQVKLPRLGTNNLALSTNYEYFDEDFHSYWEDVDLSWRMINNGWKNVFVPRAIAYHGRAAGSSPGGYAKFFSFVRHHSQIPGRIRELNYKNHIFMYIKNSPWFYPQFFVREFFMLLYILVFETRTLKVLPEVIKGIAKMWQKRRFYAKQSMPIKPTQN